MINELKIIVFYIKSGNNEIRNNITRIMAYFSNY